MNIVVVTGYVVGFVGIHYLVKFDIVSP